MTISLPGEAGMTGHELLLGMAGRIPDHTLAQARRMLADGAAGPAITLVAGLLAENPIPLTAGELAAIRDLSGDAGALPGAQPVAALPALRFGFSAAGPLGEVERDEIDEALVAAAEAHSAGLAGVWRSWRHVLPGDVSAAPSGSHTIQESTGGPDGPGAGDSADGGERAPAAGPGASLAAGSVADPSRPHRVYLVQVEDPGQIQAVAAGLLAAVADPATIGVEVITSGAEPPPYQRAALAESLLVWAVVTEPEFQVARVFDFADPVTGPGFAPGHAVIGDPAERDRLAAYLRGGYPVLTTAMRMSDVIDPAAGAVVPASFRTDGEWIWTDTAEYYLSRHGLAPDAQLTAHIEAQLARGQTVPDTGRDTAIRAAGFMLHPPASQARTPVWFPGTSAAGRA